MTVWLYNNLSEPNTLSKTIVDGVSFSGVYQGEADEVRPDIMIQSTVTGYNYAYIPDFGRYYYIDGLTVVREGLTMCRMHSDPLMSFAGAIRSIPVVALRSGDPSQQSPYINDPKMQYQSYKRVLTYSLGDLGMDGGIILVTAG